MKTPRDARAFHPAEREAERGDQQAGGDGDRERESAVEEMSGRRIESCLRARDLLTRR